MQLVDVLAYHGWGFDSNCWRNWEAVIPETFHWMNADRGYFGIEKAPEFTNNAHIRMVITHSFGLHLCSDEILSAADYLVIFAGFLNFHMPVNVFKGRSKQQVNQMISRFKTNPEKVLKAFHRQVFHPQKSIDFHQKEMNELLLLDDLEKLNKQERVLPLMKKDADIFIFQGTDDVIVPKEKGRLLVKRFGEQAHYFEIQNSGHALPITHTEKCFQMIRPKIV